MHDFRQWTFIEKGFSPLPEAIKFEGFYTKIQIDKLIRFLVKNGSENLSGAESGTCREIDV